MASKMLDIPSARGVGRERFVLTMRMELLPWRSLSARSATRRDDHTSAEDEQPQGDLRLRHGVRSGCRQAGGIDVNVHSQPHGDVITIGGGHLQSKAMRTGCDRTRNGWVC